MVLWPARFGLVDASESVRLSFGMVALWWAIFSVPLLVFVKEPDPAGSLSGWSAASAGIRQLAETFRDIRRLRIVVLFLLDYLLYLDGVGTLACMAFACVMALRSDRDETIVT